MASWRTVNHTGRTAAGVTVARPLQIDCPRCDAGPGHRCLDLLSWIGHPPLLGIYTRRNDRPHDERRTAASIPRAEVSVRGTLRSQIGVLSLVKLGGDDRIAVRRWARKTCRTEAELAVKVVELEAMPDLA